MRKLISAFVLLLALGCQPGQDFSIDDPRVRWLPGDGPMAGYFEFSNHSGVDVQIAGAESSAFGSVMLHESVERDGQMRMQHHDTVAVSTGESIAFAPGGLHLMLMNPQQDIRPGDRVTIQLRLQNGEMITAEFQVRAPGDV